MNTENASSPASKDLALKARLNTSEPHLLTEEERRLFSPALEQTPTYDGDGNLTSDGLWIYSWNGENRLASMTRNPAIAGIQPEEQITLTFTYDGQGRRIRKRVTRDNGATNLSDTLSIYDGWNLIAEYDNTAAEPSLLRAYTWGLDLSGTFTGAGGVGGLLAIHDYTGTTRETHYPCYDLNGNVMTLVGESGTVTARYEYGPFGEPLRVSGDEIAHENPIRFSTKYTDSESGLLYYGYRHYDPKTGRWLSRDPIGENGGVNLYGFVGNDGINRWDYLGLTIEADAKFLSRSQMDAEIGRFYYGFTGHPEKISLAIPEEIGNDDIEVGNSGKWARVNEAKKILLRVRVLNENVLRRPMFTQRGFSELTDHEVRRYTVYELANEKYIVPIETKGEIAVRCGCVMDNSGKAKEKLQKYLDANRKKMMEVYARVVPREQGKIGGEKWAYKDRKRDYITNPKKPTMDYIEWKPCP